MSPNVPAKMPTSLVDVLLRDLLVHYGFGCLVLVGCGRADDGSLRKEVVRNPPTRQLSDTLIVGRILGGPYVG